MKRVPYTRKALSLTLASMFLALVPGTLSAQALAITTNNFVPFAQLVVVPCANGGAGDLLLLSGILHIQSHLTINGNRVIVKDHFQPQGATALGLVTGDIYHGVGVTQFHDTIPLVNGAATSNVINNFRMIGPGPDNNLQVHQNVQITINANGDVTAVVNNNSVVCN